jgi:hypothetical protein
MSPLFTQQSSLLCILQVNQLASLRLNRLGNLHLSHQNNRLDNLPINLFPIQVSILLHIPPLLLLCRLHSPLIHLLLFLQCNLLRSLLRSLFLVPHIHPLFYHHHYRLLNPRHNQADCPQVSPQDNP